MAAKTIEAVCTNPNRSHWLAFERGRLSKEELYPVFTVSGLPRVSGEVVAEFSADRYVSSVWRDDQPAGEEWGQWRIYLRDVRPSHGVGDTGRKLISETCLPLIREWLASDDYRASREVTAWHAARRMVSDGGLTDYGVAGATRDTGLIRHELSEDHAGRIDQALQLIGHAVDLLALDK